MSPDFIQRVGQERVKADVHDGFGWGHVRPGRGPWLAMRFTWKTHTGRCVGARACGQDIRGPTRRWLLGVTHFGVQAVMGAMRFAWMDGLLAALRLTSCICDVCLYLARVQ